MKLNKQFIGTISGGESILVPVGGTSFAGIVRGNKTFGAIVELLKEETTEEQVVAAMKQRFDAPEEIIARDVKKAISELRRIGAIDG